MKSIVSIKVLLAALVLSLAILQAPAGAVVAHAGEDHEPVELTQKQNAVVYRYVAQPGDAYTLIARKAVQTYGLKKDVALSGGQIIFAETKLTQAAGSPELAIGQEVTINESAVAEAVEQAQKLSEAQEALWNEYAAGADFNTDSVGEASAR